MTATLQDRVVTILVRFIDEATPAFRRVVAGWWPVMEHRTLRAAIAGDLEPFGFREVSDW